MTLSSPGEMIDILVVVMPTRGGFLNGVKKVACKAGPFPKFLILPM